MHFARFDVAVLQQALGVTAGPTVCTKIAAKLVRTFTDRHGLKDLCRELLGVEISKQQQTSDWGAPELTPEQCAYAASDVLHLHALWARLEALLRAREPARAGAGVLRLPPGTMPARPARLRGPGHLPPLTGRALPPAIAGRMIAGQTHGRKHHTR